MNEKSVKVTRSLCRH